MSTVTHDAQSLMIDGRRIWIVSGQVDYFRIPRAQWRARVRDAAEAGLTTITVRCPWSLHEPRKGDLHFDGDLDIPYFLELIAEHGMMAILRPGPYIGSDIDLGGIPSWLLALPDIELRQSNPAFLDATSRYFRKLFDAISAFNASKGGPVVLVQPEHEWYCGNAAAADRYLLEIARFIRERDFDLPMINTNNLWHHREESMDTWSGYEQMLMYLRQLRLIHRTMPLMVGDFSVGEPDVWNAAHVDAPEAEDVMFHLAQVVAAGSQFTMTPFAGGTNFGFTSSRLPGACDRFITTSQDQGAPITEAGERTDTYYLTRRLCTFVSQFSKVFSALDIEPTSAVLAVEPIAGEAAMKGAMKSGPSVVHLKGSQGQVVFVFGDERKTGKEFNILLPDGTSIPVSLGSQPVTWCLLETHIGGRAVLNWTNLNAFGTNNRNLLVLHGAPGQRGIVCINRSELELTIPRGQTPVVEIHEEVTLVICNSNQIDSTYLHKGVVHTGICGFDDDGNPIGHPKSKKRYEIQTNGKMQSFAIKKSKATNPELELAEWKASKVSAYIEGTAPRYAVIDGPSTQEQCNAGSGYGFMRLTLSKGPGKRLKLLAPGSGDRLHFYIKGQLKEITGYGPGATSGVFELHVPPGEVSVVTMIDNLGRFGSGNDLGEGKGLVNEIYKVSTMRTGKPEVVEGRPLRPFAIRAFLEGMHANSTTSGSDYLWKFIHRKKCAIIMEIMGAQVPAMILVNDEPVAFYPGHTGRAWMDLILDGEPFRRGKNEIRIAPIGFDATESDLAESVKFYEAKSELASNAEWAFAKWERPKAISYRAVGSQANMSDLAGQPVWFRAFFTVAGEIGDQAIWFETTGLSKGQVYVNDHNLGRYFTSDPSGKPVGPQKRLLIPISWLKVGKKQKNEIVVFDEHGFSPEKSKIVLHDCAV